MLLLLFVHDMHDKQEEKELTLAMTLTLSFDIATRSLRF